MKSARLVGLIGLVGLVGFSGPFFVHAFIGPSAGQTPGSGGGLFNVDANRNIGFGTATSTPTNTFDATSTDTGTTAHGYVFLVASTSNPGIGIKSLTGLGGAGPTMYLWSVRPFGNLQLFRESGAPENLPGLVVFDITRFGNVGIATRATSTARLNVDGNVQASGSFLGSVSGAVGAGNVSSGVFGSLQGNGNFAFPASLAIGTTTTTGLPTNGLFVVGDVGIGTVNPGGTAPNTYNHIANETNELEVRARLDGRDSGVFVRDFDGTPGLDLWQDGSTGNTYIDSRYAGNDLTGTIFRTKTSGTPVTNMVLLGNGRTGVGTTTPEAVFHSVTTASGSNDTGNAGIFQSTGGAGIVTIRSSALGNFAALYGSLGTDIVGAIDFRPTVGDISFWTNNVGGSTWTERARIVNSTGFVGIATTTPSDELTVFGDIRISKSGSALIFPDGTSQTTAGTGVTAWTKNGADVYLTTASDSVGIGVTSPSAKLDISTNSGTSGVRVGTASVYSYGATFLVGSSTDINFNSRAYLSNSTNNFGIATTTPAEKLSVVGGGIFYGATGNISAGVYYDRSNSSYYLDPGANEQASSLVVAGSVGIATTSPNPSARFNIVQGGDYNAGVVAAIIENGGASNRATVRLRTTNDNPSEFAYDVNSALRWMWSTRGSSEGYKLNLYNQGGSPSYTSVSGPVLSILQDGNVGIGTSTPARRLTVAGSVEVSAGDIIFSTNNRYLFLSGSGVLNIGDAGDDINIAGGGIYAKANAGNVGIGTSTPANKFDVYDAGDGRTAFSVSDASDYRLLVNTGANDGIDFYKGTSLKFNTDSGGLNFWAGYAIAGINDYLTFKDHTSRNYGFDFQTYDGASYSSKIRVLNSGFVGIATTTPSDELTVFGDIRISKSGSALIFPDGTTQTTSAVGGGGYWALSGNNLYPTSTAYKAVIGGTVATSSLSVIGDATLYGASGNISAGVYYDRTNTAYYLDPGANENAYSLTVAGSVGIGTTGPGRTLDARGSIVLADADVSANSYYGASGDNGIIATTGTGNSALALFNTNASFANSVLEVGAVRTSNSAYWLLRAWQGNGSTSGFGTQVFGIRGDGNVGIATTTPNHKLAIDGAYYSKMVQRGNVSGSVTIDWNSGNTQHLILTGNITTLTLNNGQSGGRYTLVIKQGGTGGYEITWPASTRFSGPNPSLSNAVGDTDYVGFIYNGVDAIYDGVAVNLGF